MFINVTFCYIADKLYSGEILTSKTENENLKIKATLTQPIGNYYDDTEKGFHFLTVTMLLDLIEPIQELNKSSVAHNPCNQHYDLPSLAWVQILVVQV